MVNSDRSNAQSKTKRDAKRTNAGGKFSKARSITHPPSLHNRHGGLIMEMATRSFPKRSEKEQQTVHRNIPPRKVNENSAPSTEKLVSMPPGEKPPPAAMKLKSSLIDSRDINSFCRRMGNTVDYLRPYFKPEEVMIPEEVTRLNDKISSVTSRLRIFDNSYRAETVWDDTDAFLRLLEDGLYHTKAAVAELRHYIPASRHPENLRNASLESLESVLSEQEPAAQVLQMCIQSGYEVVQERFNDCVNLVGDGFRGELPEITASSLNMITRATQTMSLLSSLVEFETNSHGLDKKQFSLLISQQFLKDRQAALIEMFLCMCNHLMLLQETLFLKEHLFAKGAPSIAKLASMGEMMKRCWREGFVVMDRMTQTCPMFTEVAQQYYGRLVWLAASLISSMEDAEDLQNFLQNGKAMSYEMDVVKDIVRSQLWLLPCVEQLLKLMSRVGRRLKIDIKQQPLSHKKPTVLLNDMKKVMYDLVMITIGRSSWLNSYADQSSLSLLKDLRDQGSHTLAFVLNYNKSQVSLQCDQESTVQDVSHYSAMVCATNVLRNGVLQLHGLIQRPESIPEEPEGQIAMEDDTAKEEDSTEEEDDGNIVFHTVPGIKRLKSKISIEPHPVSLEGSIEFDFSMRIEEEDTINARSADIDKAMKSPWEIEEDGTPMESPFLSGPTAPLVNPSASVDSINLQSGFCEVSHSGSVGFDSDIMMRKNSRQDSRRDFSHALPPKCPSHHPSDRSPFANHQPDEPPSSVPGWDSAPLDKPGRQTSDAATGSSDVMSVVSSGLVKDVLAVDLIPGPIIGKGSEGHVLRMSYHTTPVAVKIMNHTSLNTRERFKNETKLMSKLSSHPNIVNFVGRCKDLKAGEKNSTADLVMVMEYCELGNLYKIISEANYIRELHAIGRDLTQFKEEFGYLLYTDWHRRLQVACDIAAGAAHMHDHDIVHRDLTSFNVVLKMGDNGTWVSKLCDFERSRLIPIDQTEIPRSDNLANSPAWSAPEVLRDDPYSVQADVFSLGVILWELWTLEEPWKYAEDIRHPMMIIPMVGNKGARLNIPSVSDVHSPHLHELKALIEACWNEDPSQRPTMHQAHNRILQMKANLE